MVDPLALVMTMRELARKEKLKRQYWERRALVVRPAEYQRKSRAPRRYLAMNRLANAETQRVGIGRNFVQNFRQARPVDGNRYLTRPGYRKTRIRRSREASLSSAPLLSDGVNLNKQFASNANIFLSENTLPIGSNRRAEFPVYGSVGRAALFVNPIFENDLVLGIFSQGLAKDPKVAFRITYFKIQYLINLIFRVWRLSPFNGLGAKLRDWLVLYYGNRQRVVSSGMGNEQSSSETDYSEVRVQVSVEMNLVKVSQE